MVVLEQHVLETTSPPAVTRRRGIGSVARPGERQVWTLALASSWMIDHLDGRHVEVEEMMVPRHAQTAVKDILEELGGRKGMVVDVAEDPDTRQALGMLIEGATSEKGVSAVFGTFQASPGGIGVSRLYFRHLQAEE